MRLRHSLALAPVVLALLIGCAGDGTDGVRVGATGGTPGPDTNATATPAATPTPSPTPTGAATPTPSPTPSPSPSTLTSGVDSSAPPPSVDTLPTTAPSPTPTAMPLGTIVSTAQLTGGMRGVAFPARSNTLWLLGSSDLYTLDAGATQAQELSLPASPAAFRFGPDGDVWVIGGTSLKRYVPQLMGWTVQAASLPGAAIDLAVDSSEAWVVTATGVSRFSKADLSRTDVALAAPTAIALDASNAWVTSATTNSLYRVNRTSAATTRTVSTGASPVGVAIDASGGIWTINQGDNTLTHLDSSGDALAPVGLTGSPTCLWADANTLWVGRADKQAVRIDSTQGVLGTTLLSFAPMAVAQDASGRVWFLDASGRSLVALKGR